MNDLDKIKEEYYAKITEDMGTAEISELVSDVANAAAQATRENVTVTYSEPASEHDKAHGMCLVPKGDGSYFLRESCKPASECEHGCPTPVGCIWCASEPAARLEKILNRYDRNMDAKILLTTIDRLEADNKRMREVLERIATRVEFMADPADVLQDMARQALTKEE